MIEIKLGFINYIEIQGDLEFLDDKLRHHI